MKARLDTALLVLAALLAWQVVSLLVGGERLPSPPETIARSVALLASPALWRQAAATGRTLAEACLLVAGVGLVGGCLIGSSRLLSEVVEPMLPPLYAIPKIALYPVILLLLGLTPTAAVVFAALHGIFPVLIFTIGGIRKIKPIHRQTAEALRLGRVRTILSVLVPAAVPDILAGLRIGFATTLFGALIAELFASTGGVGFMLIRATDRHDMGEVLALTLLVFGFAVAANAAISRLERQVRHGG